MYLLCVFFVTLSLSLSLSRSDITYAQNRIGTNLDSVQYSCIKPFTRIREENVKDNYKTNALFRRTYVPNGIFEHAEILFSAIVHFFAKKYLDILPEWIQLYSFRKIPPIGNWKLVDLEYLFTTAWFFIFSLDIFAARRQTLVNVIRILRHCAWIIVLVSLHLCTFV